MGFEFVKSTEVAEMTALAIDLKAYFADPSNATVTLRYKAEEGNANDAAWAKRISDWTLRMENAIADADAATDDADKLAHDTTAIAAKQNLTKALNGRLGFGEDKSGKVRILAGSFIANVFKAMSEVNSLRDFCGSNVVRVTRRKTVNGVQEGGINVADGTVELTFSKARGKRGKVEAISQDQYGASLDAAYVRMISGMDAN